ncbi:MAG: hypothetical protein PHO98_11000 [Synergistaceae bacterium]|nr:hypothetical protein [Synergistaceae bacterium]MDD4611563.1 hypothetical protein [Synergistaceae bacterium]
MKSSAQYSFFPAFEERRRSGGRIIRVQHVFSAVSGINKHRAKSGRRLPPDRSKRLNIEAFRRTASMTATAVMTAGTHQMSGVSSVSAYFGITA